MAKRESPVKNGMKRRLVAHLMKDEGEMREEIKEHKDLRRAARKPKDGK